MLSSLQIKRLKGSCYLNSTAIKFESWGQSHTSRERSLKSHHISRTNVLCRTPSRMTHISNNSCFREVKACMLLLLNQTVKDPFEKRLNSFPPNCLQNCPIIAMNNFILSIILKFKNDYFIISSSTYRTTAAFLSLLFKITRF